MRSSALDTDGNGETMPVCHSHDFRSLTSLCFPDPGAPFFDGAKLPSMKASSTSIRPWILSSAARASRIPLITPDWTHCWNRRWQVWYDGYRSGSSTPGAPVRKTHKIPFRTARRSFQGRPRPSRRLAGSGTRGSRIYHCWSVRSRLWHIPVLMP